MQVTAIFDTETKQLTVTKNGMPVENIEYVSFYPDWEELDKMRVEIVSADRERDDGTSITTVITASGKEIVDPPVIYSKVVARKLGLI